MQNLELGYGSSKVRVELPPEFKAQVFAPGYSEPLEDVSSRVVSALEKPNGTPLASLCSGARRVLVIVPDRTRVAGAKEYLPPLMDYLVGCGLGEDNLEVLVATGMHELAGPDGLTEFLPESVVDRFRVTEHDCYDKSGHFHAGRTRRGTEVKLNKKAAEADLIVLTGSIGLHYFAGYRGGRKAVLPGISSFETICANHKLTLTKTEGFHPLCRNASLDGNPVNEDMMEALGMIPRSFLLNTITDLDGNVLGVFAGDTVEAHVAGCDALKKQVSVMVPGKADCVLVSCGGYPRDSTMVQSHKAVDNMAPVLAEGGPMVVLAENRHGMGSQELPEWFEEGGLSAVRRKLEGRYTFHGHTALSILEKVNRFKIYLVSGFKDDVVRRMGFVPARSAEQALAEIARERKGELRTFVFPEGSETLPLLG